MRRINIFALLTLFLCFNSIYSQTLTYSNSGLAIGDVISSRKADTTGVQPGPAGSNVTWDFSNLSIGSEVVSQIGINPAVTPYASSFPEEQ